MMPENLPQNFDEASFYRRLSNQNPEPPSKLEMPEAYRKLTVGGKDVSLQVILNIKAFKYIFFKF